MGWILLWNELFGLSFSVFSISPSHVPLQTLTSSGLASCAPFLLRLLGDLFNI